MTDSGLPTRKRLTPKVSTSGSLPAETGGKGQYNYGPGNFGLIILNKNSADRIKRLLKVIDYIVAPFGSQEYLVVNYGLKDQDYQLDENGNPKRTPQGVQNLIGWQGVMGAPAPTLFDPQLPDFAPTMNAALSRMRPSAGSCPRCRSHSPVTRQS